MNKKLPTKEEFMKTLNFAEEDITMTWNKELFVCPQCGGGVKRDHSKQFMSNPPKYRYFCKSCTYSDIF